MQIPQFDSLQAFAEWYLKTIGPLPLAPANGFNKAGVFTGLTLYRQGQFQVQMWLCPPESVIPDHSHPNVDSIQVFLCGDICFRKNGELTINQEKLDVQEDGVQALNTFSTRILPTDTHGASIGKRGGAFLTFQHWLKGEPQSVELDWEGEPLDAEHKSKIANHFQPEERCAGEMTSSGSFIETQKRYNETAKNDVIVADGFAAEPWGIRTNALGLDYSGSKEFDGHPYKGVGLGYTPNLKTKIERLVGFEIEIKLAFFRSGAKQFPLTTYIHADRNCGQFAGILYLNPGPEKFSGTAFWKHRSTGLRVLPASLSDADAKQWDDDGQDESKWELLSVVENQFNRFVCYPTKLFHSRYPNEQSHESIQDARLVWVVFFDRVKQ